MDGLKSTIESVFVRGLKPLLDPLHSALDQLPPPLWRASVCLFLIVGTLWTLLLKRESVFRGCQVTTKWADLRLWVVVVLVPYLLIYLLF